MAMIGRRVSHFYVIRSLGSGGMGVVYEAQDTRLPRSVAIKFLNPGLAADTDAIRRFKREARLASSFNHPNICTILDVDEGDGQPFIAMELLQGQSLKARLQHGTLPLDEILGITIQIAEALATAHDHGIMHRDITPGNIFLTTSGAVKLLDFGLARQFGLPDGDSSEDLTTPGAVAGTIHYMAPEQLDPRAAVDHRCDLFSLGAVLYHMCTGARPFDASSRHEVIAAIREQPHIPLRQLAPDRPLRLERLVDELLSKKPEDRCQSAWTVGAELKSMHRDIRKISPPLSSVPDAARVAVAVLPFQIIGSPGDVLDEFREGLVEDINFRLRGMGNLRVAPRTSTRTCAAGSIRAIGQQLGVDFVIEGSVQFAGDRLRVSAAILDSAQEHAVGDAIKVDHHFDNVLSAQDRVAADIAQAVAATVQRAPSRRYTDDPDAYLAFKRGQHHWKTCFSGGWRPAIEQFQYATERDPRFALAHVALAHAYNFLGFYCLMKPTLAFDVARQAAERAISIGEGVAAAHVELAVMRFGGEWDWDASEAEFRRALALEPGNALAHVYYSWLLTLLGRTDAAFAEAEAGCRLAPSSRLVSGARAQMLYVSGRYDEAIDACTEILRFDPTYVFAIQVRGVCYMAQSRHRLAIGDLERAAELTERPPFYLGLLGLCYGGAGMRDEALRLVAELNDNAGRMYVPPQCYVFIYAGLGQRDKALAFQEKAYEDGASPFNYLTPPIRELYALDPQHKTRLEQMRLMV